MKERNIDLSPSKTLYTDHGTMVALTLFAEVPNVCPMCNHNIQPVQLHNYPYTDSINNWITFTYLCTNCYKPFIATHRVHTPRNAPIEFLAPTNPVKRKFSDALSNLSPAFVRIYHQAAHAEAHSLDEIAGLGYRKALEFLIKDFAIHTHPDDRERIVGMHLGDCINNYIDHAPLKTTAKSSSWLANDQAHYKQKYESKDLEVLKRFMHNCITWVDLVLGTQEAEAFLESGQ